MRGAKPIPGAGFRQIPKKKKCNAFAPAFCMGKNCEHGKEAQLVKQKLSFTQPPPPEKFGQEKIA